MNERTDGRVEGITFLSSLTVAVTDPTVTIRLSFTNFKLKLVRHEM